MHGPWSKPYTEQKGTEAHNDTHSANVGAKEKHDKDICLQPPKNKSPSACRLIFYVHLSPPLPLIFLPLALPKATPTIEWFAFCCFNWRVQAPLLRALLRE